MNLEVQNIFCLPLSKLTNIHPELNEEFFSGVIKALPVVGKETNTYYLINNTLTLNNDYNLQHIELYNIFVQQSQLKAQLLQILKNV